MAIPQTDRRARLLPFLLAMAMFVLVVDTTIMNVSKLTHYSIFPCLSPHLLSLRPRCPMPKHSLQLFANTYFTLLAPSGFLA